MCQEAVFFVGIDLSDPFSKHRRNCTRAILNSSLHCIFDEWEYNETGLGIVPHQIGHLPVILSIDGPQGLAESPDLHMRQCEQQLGAAGKSPYDLPPLGRPYAGFICGSVRLFYLLYRSGGPHLYGMEGVKGADANLIEVYPGSAWPALAGYRLRKKTTLDGRKDRYDLLVECGLKFARGYIIEKPPTHDQLDASIAAYIAYLFKAGNSIDYGKRPIEDAEARVLREGLIVQPVKKI